MCEKLVSFDMSHDCGKGYVRIVETVHQYALYTLPIDDDQPVFMHFSSIDTLRDMVERESKGRELVDVAGIFDGPM